MIDHFRYWLHRQELSAADTTQTTCFGGKRLWWTSTARVKTSCAKECKWPGYLWHADCLVLCKAVQSVSSLFVALEKHEVISSAVWFLCDFCLIKNLLLIHFHPAVNKQSNEETTSITGHRVFSLVTAAFVSHVWMFITKLWEICSHSCQTTAKTVPPCFRCGELRIV